MKTNAVNAVNKDTFIMALGKTWNGMDWNGLEWNGMDWNGMEFYQEHFRFISNLPH